MKMGNDGADRMAAAREIMKKLGPTGEGADPNDPNDRGGVNVAIINDGEFIRMEFGTELSWLKMPKESAIAFGHMLIAMAEKEDD